MGVLGNKPGTYPESEVWPKAKKWQALRAGLGRTWEVLTWVHGASLGGCGLLSASVHPELPECHSDSLWLDGTMFSGNILIHKVMPLLSRAIAHILAAAIWSGGADDQMCGGQRL